MKMLLVWNRKCKLFVRGYSLDDLDSLSEYLRSCWRLPFDFDDRIRYRESHFKLKFNQPTLQTIDNLVHSVVSDSSYLCILNQLLASECISLEIHFVDVKE